MIKIENIFFSYPAHGENHVPINVLRDISLEIEEGSFTAVLGHNGSGKSTLAKLLNATLTPTKGVVTVDGISTAEVERVFDVRQRVGMVFQNPDNQLVATIVEDDIAFAPENLGLPPDEIRRRVDAVLKAVGMTEYRRRAPHMLSGGQKQRVAIAGVLAMEPKYIVLDEPTAMLDPVGRHEVMSILHRLNKEKGITVILITHNIEEAQTAGRIVVLNKGKVYLDGSPRVVLAEGDLLEKVGLALPQVLELAHQLRKSGIDIPKDAFEDAEIAAAIGLVLRNGT